MDTNATITITRGYSDDGGFSYAEMTSTEVTGHDLYELGTQLQNIGSLRRVCGYQCLSEQAIRMLGESFTIAQLQAYIADGRRLQAEREERRRLGLFKCDCGHVVARNLMMSTSQGTSCPDCYDRMSD